MENKLKTILDNINRMSIKRVKAIFNHYARGTVVIDDTILRQLVALLRLIEKRYGSFGKPKIAFLPDFGFAVLLEGCNYEEWKGIARDIKKELRESGLTDLVGKVAVICVKGLTEM